MKKILTFLLTAAVLVTMFAAPAAAVDNYEPKTIKLVVNDDNTVSIPEGYVVYLGDTIVFPRSELIFKGDFTNKATKQVEKNLELKVGNVGIYIEDGNKRLGHAYFDEICFTDDVYPGGTKGGWKQSSATLNKVDEYTFKAMNGVGLDVTDTQTATLYDLEFPTLITITPVDPKTVSEIVLPPEKEAEPEESSEAPESSEEVVSEAPASSEEVSLAESSEDIASETVSSAPAESKEDKTSSEATADAPASSGGAIIWIIVAVVAVVAVVVVIAVVSKKKK